jgi:hypothetical protein
VVLAAALAGPVASADARRVVPAGFFGVTLDGPLQEPTFDLAREASLMSSNGVEAVRFVAYWSAAQPYRSFAEVPAAERSRFRNESGVPTDFRASDRFVGDAAARGIRAMPVILHAPIWGRQYADRPGSPPQREPFARFALALVRRYGPSGTFWNENPQLRRLPVRDWQIWNEPNHAHYWNAPGVPDEDSTASVRGYVSLLKKTRAYIRSGDRRARVVHAGVDGFSWVYLAKVYRAGGRRAFDVYAAHPFTSRPSGVVTILRLIRRTMTRARDRRKALTVSEWAWPSSRGHAKNPGNIGKTTRGQAQSIAATMKLFKKWRRRLRLINVFHYSWLSSHTPGARFTYAGLRYRSGRSVFSKPALRAFRSYALAYEGCRRKSPRSATRCLKRRR